MTGKPGMLQFMVLQGVRHDLVTKQQKQGQWNAQKPCIGPKECHGVENQCFLVKNSNNNTFPKNNREVNGTNESIEALDYSVT